MVSVSAPPLDVAALFEHAVAVRKASRIGREPRASGDEPGIAPDKARWWRLAATHAVQRLEPGAFATATWGGLQDSAPRSALLALHARMNDVGPDHWEHSSLVQIWLRSADYVVPRNDVAVFTLGTLPRDPHRAAALNALADRVCDAVGDTPTDGRRVKEVLPELNGSSVLRSVCSTGRVHIRWDARTTALISADRPHADPEEMRRELARRFVHWYGPVGPSHFAKWAGVTRDDAAATWEALAEELAEVHYGDRKRWLLREDSNAVLTAQRPRGVRLLPAGDPVLFMDDHVAHRRDPDEATGVTSRLVNSLTGRIVVDGEIVGAWGRAKGNVALHPWPQFPWRRDDEVEAEAVSFAAVLGRSVAVRWLEPS